MKITIMGTGGVGGYYGALLAKAGEDVTFVARGEHLEAIRERGLHVRSRASGEFTVKAKATKRWMALSQLTSLSFASRATTTMSP